MNKRVVIVMMIGIVILAGGIAVMLFFLPVQNAQKEASTEYNDAWKLERIQGSWTCEDEKYELSIDGYDFTLKVNGVYAAVASIRFDASEKPQEEDVRFTLQIHPASVIYPDAPGAYYCEIDELWYENGMIYMRPAASEGGANDPVCLTPSAVLQQTSWPLN